MLYRIYMSKHPILLVERHCVIASDQKKQILIKFDIISSIHVDISTFPFISLKHECNI